jgi:hypothetical protein
MSMGVTETLVVPVTFLCNLFSPFATYCACTKWHVWLALADLDVTVEIGER